MHDAETIRQTQVQARGNRFIACIGYDAFQNTFCGCKILQYVVSCLIIFIAQVIGEDDYTPLEMTTQVGIRIVNASLCNLTTDARLGLH